MTYEWWQRAIAGEKIGSELLPIHESEPQYGFFRRRTSKGGGYIGVAIFPHPETGDMIAVQNGEQVDPLNVWTWVAQYPVTEASYRAWSETGKWPDLDEAVTQSLATPGIGDNRGPTDDADIIAAQIAAASANAAEYAEIRDDETASKAQSVRSRLLELSREADKRREKLKAPHLEAGKTIDALWNPMVKAAKATADGIAKALGAHETRKAREVAEVARKVEEERRAAEAERQKAIAAQLAAHPDAPMPEAAPIVPVPPPLAPEPVTAIRGAYGRAAAVKLVKICVVQDFDAAYLSLKANLELKALISKLAQKAVDAGYEVGGCTVTEERKVT
jgi:hypothetical protein